MKKIFSFLAFFLFSVFIIAQNSSVPPEYENLDISQNPNFYDIKSEMESYLTTNPDPRLQKKFSRWVAFWEYKVDLYDGNPGSFIPAMEFYQNQLLNGEADGLSEAAENCNWECVGPIRKKVNGSTINQYDLAGIGRITSLWVGNETTNVSNPQLPQGSFILAGSGSGGIWKTTNANAVNLDDITWVNVTDNLKSSVIGVSEIIEVKDSEGLGRTFYATVHIDGTSRFGYGLGILKSIDDGDTWEFISIGNFSNGTGIQNIVSNPSPTNNDILFALRDDKVIKTTNGFNTYSIADPDSFCGSSTSSCKLVDIVVHPTDRNIMYLSSGVQFYRSIDAGAHWSPVDLPVPPTNFPNNTKIDRIDIAVSEVGGDDVYLCIHHGKEKNAQGQVVKNPATRVLYSNDAGQNFINHFTGPIQGYQEYSSTFIQTFAVSNIQPDRLYIGLGASGSNELNAARIEGSSGAAIATRILDYRTGGTNGKEIHADQRNIFLADDGSYDIVYFANDGGGI